MPIDVVVVRVESNYVYVFLLCSFILGLFDQVDPPVAALVPTPVAQRLLLDNLVAVELLVLAVHLLLFALAHQTPPLAGRTFPRLGSREIHLWPFPHAAAAHNLPVISDAAALVALLLHSSAVFRPFPRQVAHLARYVLARAVDADAKLGFFVPELPGVCGKVRLSLHLVAHKAGAVLLDRDFIISIRAQFASSLVVSSVTPTIARERRPSFRLHAPTAHLKLDLGFDDEILLLLRALAHQTPPDLGTLLQLGVCEMQLWPSLLAAAAQSLRVLSDAAALVALPRFLPGAAVISPLPRQVT